jgi:hypothetical protein
MPLASPPSLLARLLAFLIRLLSPPPTSRQSKNRPLPAVLPFVASDELRFFSHLPLTTDRQPVYRSLTAAHLGELGNEQAALMDPFSLDEEENLTHLVARYHRAGLLDLIAGEQQRLAELRRLNRPPSTLRRHHSAPGAEDPEQMQRFYGSPVDDHRRLLRYHQRRDGIDAARRSGRLPSRAVFDLCH